MCQAILCSPRAVFSFTRAPARGSLPPPPTSLVLLSHARRRPTLPAAGSRDSPLSQHRDRFLRHYIVANCSTNFEIISPDNEVRLHNVVLAARGVMRFVLAAPTSCTDVSECDIDYLKSLRRSYQGSYGISERRSGFRAAPLVESRQLDVIEMRGKRNCLGIVSPADDHFIPCAVMSRR